MSFGASSKRATLFNRRPLASLSSFILAVAVGLISSFTFSTAYDMARSALGAEQRSVAGVWRGEWHGVPAVTIKLMKNGDSLSGTASFNRIFNSENGLRSEASSQEIPIVNPRLEGKRLLFELQAPDNIQPTIFIKMEMSFENEDEAVLHCTGRESTDSSEEPVRLRREPPF